MHRIVLLASFLLGSALWAQDSTLLVLHKGGSFLGFYSPAGQLLAKAPTGAHPHEMALGPGGRLLYTTDNGTMRIEEPGQGGNSVSIFDVAARKKVGQISLGEFHRPHGIALQRSSGRIAVTSELPDRLLLIDPQTKTVVKTYDTQGKISHMVTFGPADEWAYVSNSGSANVSAIHMASGKVRLIPTGERPEGSVLSADGKELYVANREARSVTVIDTSRQVAVARIDTGNGPVRIARTPDGKLLVYALIHEDKIEIADAASRKVLGQAPGVRRPVSLSVSRDGKFAYASDEQRDIIYVVSIAERKIVRRIHTPSGAGPDPVMEIAAR